MKAFEVRLKKDRSTPHECHFEWPEWWGEVCAQIDVVAYEDSHTRGFVEEGAVCVCDDDVWSTILNKNDARVVELDEVEANAKGRAWRPQVERITDEKAVLSILAKQARGEDLTKADRDALDPDSETSGVNRAHPFDIQTIARERNDVFRENRERR